MPTANKDGLEFGPNGNGKRYLSLYYHRGTANPRKTTWDQNFTPHDEFALFDVGDTSEWICSGGHQWGIIDDGGRRLGSNGERVSFCPRNMNPQDPWHGYPVTTSVVDYEVPEEVIVRWLDQKIVSKVTAKRLRRGAL